MTKTGDDAHRLSVNSRTGAGGPAMRLGELGADCATSMLARLCSILTGNRNRVHSLSGAAVTAHASRTGSRGDRTSLVMSANPGPQLCILAEGGQRTGRQ